ncbi:MAG: carbon monoxide dehydrogenase beta subunit family protein [Ignisphaera sp.]
MALEYWLKGDIPPGPIKATLVMDPSKAVEIIRKFVGQQVILIGSNIEEIEKAVGDVITHVIEMAKALKSPIITSSSYVVKKLDDNGFREYKILPPLEAIQKISKGLIPCRLAIFIGFRYAYGWLLLNSIKHYKPEIQTLSLDPYAQPNATWTLPSLPLTIWYKNLNQLIENIKSVAQK